MKVFKSFHEVIDFAISEEIKAMKFYKMLSDFVEEPEIAEALYDLALVESGHKKKLEAIKAGRIILEGEEAGDLGITSQVEDVEPDAKMDYIDLLKIGMKQEEAARKLYMDLAKAAQTNEIRDIFLKLANEEAQHKMRFELEYDLRTF
ncbi:MAG: ferritin family protein [Sedimentisphaerales bacterium]|nr:ferritin family protein [Sedimentisphaerales bacterium]